MCAIHYTIIMASHYDLIIYRIAGVTVQPQNVAIPTSMITVNSDGRPVFSFYVQFDNDTFVSSAVVKIAIQVRTFIEKVIERWQKSINPMGPTNNNNNME